MDEPPSGWERRNWALRESLPDQWAETPPRKRDRVLAYWLRASETDEWTFDQLRDLVGALLDAGKTMPALDQWAREFAAGRREKPIRPGRKSDPTSDHLTMAEIEVRKAVRGESDRAAQRAVAEERNPIHPQYDKVRGEHERGRKGLPGVWPNSE